MKSVLEFLAFGDTERALQAGSVKGGVLIRQLSLTEKDNNTYDFIDRFFKAPSREPY